MESVRIARLLRDEAKHDALLMQLDEFKARVRDSGMLDFWRENGWPDLCRPLDADDFECE